MKPPFLHNDVILNTPALFDNEAMSIGISVIDEDGVVSMLARPAFNPRYDGIKFADLGFLDHRHPEL